MCERRGKPVNPVAVAHLEQLADITRGVTTLVDGERKSLLQVLQMVRRESSGRGQRLMEPFADREYGGMPAPKFFARCYAMRSALVHGHEKRPTAQDVRQVGSDLENLVGHAIAGRGIVDAVLGALPTA